MDFISVTYLLFLLILLLIYYRIPQNRQWISLLVFSILFYSLFSLKIWFFFLITAVTTYAFGRWFCKKRAMLFITIAGNVLILFALKLFTSGLYIFADERFARLSVLVPVGISFYTLQTIAYMVDVYREKVLPEQNFFRYLLFMLFFPQILQGPIPRYGDLKDELFSGHRFCEETFLSGFYLLLWGW